MSLARSAAAAAFCSIALAAAAQQQEAPYTLHITKQEVVVDIMATGAHNRPVLNLAPQDLQVFDESDAAHKSPKAITSLRVIDPATTPSPSNLPYADFFGIVHGTCMLAYTPHYQLTYDPGLEGATAGIHTVLIQAKRRGVKLSYRHSYLFIPQDAQENPAHKPAPPTIYATANAGNQPATPKFQTNNPAGLAAQRAIDYSANSFGTTTPRAGALCADVYEIPHTTKRIPKFSRLAPIGIVYTSFLSVSRATNFIGMGLPNITTRSAWLGIDYYGSFWITHPGNYEFQLTSDDGALLEIDNKRVIDLDGIHPPTMHSATIALARGPHILHIPYFQGPPPGIDSTQSAVLILWVTPPGQPPVLFDTRNFAPPVDKSE